MAAFQTRLLHRGQIPQNRQSGLALQNRREIVGKALPAIGEQQTGNPAVRTKVNHAAHLRRETEPHALRAQHEDHGRARLCRDVPGAGLLRAGNAVIVAHRAFEHGNVARAPVERSRRAVVALQKQVEVPARNAEHAGMEHGVDIIRAAFERADVQSAFFQRREQRADGNRLARAAVHCGEHDPLHAPYPTIR